MPVENADLARRLRDAYGGRAVDSLRDVLTEQVRAYAVQEANTHYWLSEGRRLVGRKIGLTAPVVQAQLGVDEPDFGMLFADMQVREGEVISLDSLIQPRIEAEVAFLLQQGLSGRLDSVQDILPAIAYAVPALEIVDSRIRDWQITICDTIADNASSALFVLGAHRFSPTQSDLPAMSVTLYREGTQVSEGCGADCLGNPLNAVLWLADKLQSVGRPLESGDIVLSGALGKMVAVDSPGEYRADFGDLGSVTAAFARGRH